MGAPRRDLALAFARAGFHVFPVLPGHDPVAFAWLATREPGIVRLLFTRPDVGLVVVIAGEDGEAVKAAA